MTQYVINCGCGRQMSPDGQAGRDAFRCGCGQRIRIAAAPTRSRACWYEGCRMPVVSEPPLNFCADHRDDAILHFGHRLVRANWEAILANAASSPTRSLGSYRQPKFGADDSWVYFMRRERLIKIGTTTNLVRRSQELNAVVIAHCPGSYSEEARLHARFADLRQHGEWFEPGPELLTLVNAIRAENRQPPILS